MDAVALSGLCVVLPRQSGTRKVMPAGFHAGNRYSILEIFTPNGSSDLHLRVVGEGGKIYPLRYDSVKITSIRSIGQCIVLPRKSGSDTVMPAGFNAGTVYGVVLPFTPNGSSDLHLWVVGEGGMIYPLLATAVKMVSSSDRPSWAFPDASRTWEVAGTMELGWAETCLDDNGRKMLPHRVTWDEGFNQVTVEWTKPVSGHLLIG